MASPQHPTREACGKAPAASRSAVDLPALDLRLALSTAPKDSRSTGAVASSTSAPTFRGGQRTPAHQPTKDRTTVSLLSHPRGAGWTGGHVAVAMPPSAPAAPIVHLRVRPLIPRLGECAEQRQVWCVDHESVVVREIGSRPTLHDHPSGASASLSASPHHPSQSMRQLATRTFPDADQQQNYSTSASVSSLTDGCGTGTRLRGQQSPGLAAQDGLGSSSSRCSGVDQDHDELEEGLHDEAHPPHSSSVNQPENSNPVASPQSSGEGASNPLSPTQVTNSTEAADGTKLEWARHTHHRSASSPRPISCSSTSPCEASDLDAKIEPPSSPLAAPVLLEDTRSVEQQFRCDCVHDDQVTQEEVFEESVVHFADEALLGQNIAILCHGATGSGKTYTMMGSRTHGGEREVVADAGPFPEPHPTNNLSSGRGGRRRAAAVPPSAADQVVGEAPGDDGDEEGDWPSVEELLSSKEVDIDSSTDEDDVRTFRSSEMGILPRLVQVLLERCGERVVLRHREEGLVKSSGSYGSTTPRSVRSSVRKGGEPTNAATPPSQAATTPTTTLTLRELTLFGVEVYMDEVYDLMDPGKRKLSSFPETGGLEGLCTRLIHAREEAEAGLKSARRASRGLSPQGSRGAGTSVVGGGGIPIRSTRDVYQAYALACQNRITASPEMHEHDSTSRSHAVFLLQLGFDLCDARRNGAKPLVQRVRSYAVMVDLAGCERQKVSREGGEARREARSIHQSLSALSSVVQALMQRSKTVPYRDAKLTRLLRPCLEGGHVLVLIHLSPCSAQETQQSLRFADHIHQTRPASCGGSTTKELQSIFDELVDPTLGQQEEEYRQSEDLFAKLCVEVRLAHMTRFPGYISHSAGSSSSSDEEAGGASPSSDSKDESTVAAISRHEHEGGVLEDPSSPSTLRTFLTRTLVERHNAPLRRREQRSMQKARQRIEVEKRRRVEQATQRMQHVLQQARNSIEELQWVNTRLSTEKNAPVPQDPYSLELSKQLKETTEDMSRNARERWSLSTIVSSLKQRLAVQDELELSLDAEIEELPSVHGRGTDGERSLAASITQPSSSTGGEERPDAELRDICRQQAQLAKEMSSLRLEAVCFGMGDGIWEGLWARVMRHELLTAMWVERALMEDIMLDPIGLQFMFQLGGLPVAGRCSATERQLRSRVSSYLTQGSAQAQPPRSSRGKRDKTEPPAISLPPAFRLDGADAHDDDHHPTSTKSAEPRSSDRGPVALATANGGELLRQPIRPSGLRLTEVYGDEEQLQRAAFRRLTEEGLPCEICCVGDTFDAVLSQFLCPTSSKEETDEEGIDEMSGPPHHSHRPVPE